MKKIASAFLLPVLTMLLLAACKPAEPPPGEGAEAAPAEAAEAAPAKAAEAVPAEPADGGPAFEKASKRILHNKYY